MSKTYELEFNGDVVEFDKDLTILRYRLYSDFFNDHYPIEPSLVKKSHNKYEELLERMELKIAEDEYFEKYNKFKSKMETA